MNPLKLTRYLTVYGLAHAIVDASCILLVLGGIDVKENLPTFIIIYNTLAFGLQLPFGLLLDKLQRPGIFAMAGCSLLIISLMLVLHPFAATIIAGIGNALFHVGGGTVSLNLKPGKAALPGVFVAPGGIGLFAGGLVAKFYGYPYKPFIILLLTSILLIFLIRKAPVSYETRKEKPVDYTALAVLFLLITVCIRSAVGLSVSFPWKSDIALLVTLTVFITLGKGLGGFIADYFGWIKISVGGLAISAIIMFWGAHYPMLGIFGMFLFNFTMPVTLVAISNMLPGRPGFSFGLTTLAILAGAFPNYLNFSHLLPKEIELLLLTLCSALCLFLGLRLYFNSYK